MKTHRRRTAARTAPWIGAALARLGVLVTAAVVLAGEVAAAPPVGAAVVERSAAGTAPSACRLPDLRAEVLRQVNALRARGASCGVRGGFAAAPGLSWQGALAAAAAVHAGDMAQGGFISHTGSDGRGFDQRISAAGYRWRTVAENVAFGFPDVGAVMAGWVASAGHCANLMNPDVRDVGMACARAADGRLYWAMDLAR